MQSYFHILGEPFIDDGQIDLKISGRRRNMRHTVNVTTTDSVGQRVEVIAYNKRT